MTEQKMERLLKKAAQSSEMSGWNDRLQWLVDATMAGCRGGLALEDAFLDEVAAGKGLPDFPKATKL